METRARYLLIGVFVILVAIGLASFALWVADSGRGGDRRYYDILFQGSVAGLVEGGDVRYRGIRIGSVSDITISPEDPTRARVTVEVIHAPIRQGDVAALAMQGITGVLYVNIEGATREDPLLEAAPGDRYPVIPSRPSSLNELLEGAPGLVNSAARAADSIAQMTGEENQRLLREILGDFRMLSQALVEREQQIGRILSSFDRARSDFEVMVSSLRLTLEHTEEAMGNDVPAMVADYRAVATRLEGVLERADQMLVENQEPLRQFTTDGLAELSNLIVDVRTLVARLGAVTDQLETEGVTSLLGPSVREVEVEP